MKKVLLILMIGVVFLTGCNKNENVNNQQEEINSGENNSQNENSSGENNVQNEVNSGDDNSQDDIEKYKLSDKYYLEESDYDGYFDLGYMRGIKTESSIEFESNNKKYTLATKEEIIKYDGNGIYGEAKYIKIYINGQKIDNISEVYNVAIIDLDKNDNSKEIAVNKKAGDIFVETIVYRINDNDQLEQIYVDGMQPAVLCYANDTYFFPVFLFGGMSRECCGPIIGYYIYENGKFVYIDRMLTGEKTFDSNGKFVLEDEVHEFSNEALGLYITNGEKGIEVKEDMVPDVYGVNGRFRVLSFKLEKVKEIWGDDYIIGIPYYDIELLDDANWVDYDGNILEELEKGTVLKDVTVSYYCD